MNLPHHASGERDYITMRTLTVVRQYLAAAFLLVIGLVAYGCGDSATVTPVVELASLTVDPGTLQPAFSGGTTQYNVDVSNNISSVTITAQPAVAGDSVTINGQATTNSVITLGAAGTTTPVNIVVSESGTNSRTYTVLLVRAGLTGNNSLQNLTVSSGTLAPTFDENTQDYTVDVASNVGSINVTPTLDDPNATMTVNRQATNSGQSSTISLNPAGQSTLITTVVTAQNLSNKTYRITVSRGVSSNNNLRTLTASPGALSPAFSATSTRTSYTVNVNSTVESVTVSATPQDTTASLSISPRPATLGSPGTTTPVFIVVTAQNGTQKTYTVGVTRAALGGNNNLLGLTVSPGPLDDPFNANDLSYTVNVASTVTSITVTPTRQDPNATITVTPPGTGSGQARTIPLNGAGSNTLINIVVTAPNGSQKTYSVNVIQAALGGNNNLSALTVTPGPLAPTFTQNTLNYTVNVASTVTSVNVSARKSDPNAVMSGDVTAGAGTASGSSPSIQLGGPGTSRVVSIAVTAPNGSSKTYTITLERAAQASNNNLSALTVTPGPLAPTFTQNTLNYTVNVASTVTSVNVSATKADPNAVMSEDVTAGSGTATGQATIQLGGPGTATIVLITVTAPNSSSKTYRINVNRAAPASNNNLSALTVSPGSLTPSFAAGRVSYTSGVATDVSSINVSATKADPNAVMSGDVTAGTGVPTGQATIPLNGAGTSTPVSITVTAPNGNSETYSITVNRALAEPPPPTVAPDLFTEDDSCAPGVPDPAVCAPGTSKDDNVTNVTRPRFSIPQPGSGETAKLYINGNEVPSSFNSGDNTLRPNAPLPDGGYDITYTLSNSGGESDPSPVMAPQLLINTTPSGGV
jgi:Cadherin-like beta sandwich domain